MSDTDRKILEAALDLFASQGFHGTSIREIAERVGIQKSSIYNH
ncbi:MAG: TetR/AcrR family transcriptional regulator, partial [bacterium]